MLSPAVDNLVAQLTRLPGIGTRTAQRLAFHILAAPADEANAIGSAIAEVKARVRPCRECGNLTEDELCGVCSDPRRDRTVICVVEQPVDSSRSSELTSTAASTTSSAVLSRRWTVSSRATYGSNGS